MFSAQPGSYPLLAGRSHLLSVAWFYSCFVTSGTVCTQCCYRGAASLFPAMSVALECCMRHACLKSLPVMVICVNRIDQRTLNGGVFCVLCSDERYGAQLECT